MTAGLREHFRAELTSRPEEAYRDWFRLQEELREEGDSEIARLLAEDLWELLPKLFFSTAEDRARFLHNTGVFFGCPGPAASLPRARECFTSALGHFMAYDESGWRARTLHNFATALSNLGSSAADLEEAIALFERALAWRTAEREVARGVTLHNLGIAWRRLGELSADRRADDLERSEAVLTEALEIRERLKLREGRAHTLLHLAYTLERLAESEGPSAAAHARRLFGEAGREFEALQMPERAAMALGRS